MEYALEILGLCKSYKSFLLRNATFRVPTGSIMGLIGPNGAGKTTIVKIIMNLVRRDAGEVLLFGLDHVRHEREAKARFGCNGALLYFSLLAVPFPLWPGKGGPGFFICCSWILSGNSPDAAVLVARVGCGARSKDAAGMDDGSGHSRLCRDIAPGLDPGVDRNIRPILPKTGILTVRHFVKFVKFVA